MKTVQIFCFILAICSAATVFCSAQALIPTPAGPISIEMIQQDLDAQKYSDVIRKTSAALQYKGPSAAQLDRARLYSLRAEAYLRLKQFVPAADTFTLAAKEATDEKDIALDKSTALLIHRSVAGQYSPKFASGAQPVGARAPKPPPIGIVDPDSRKIAMKALFDDELRAATPKLQAAARQSSLPPLMNSINDVHELRLLELAATEQDASCAQLFTTLENRAGQLMSDAIKSMTQKVEQISKTANNGTTGYQDFPNGGGRQTVTTKSGLTSNDADALNDVIDTTKKIAAACEEFAKAVPTNTGDSTLARVDADASKLSDRAGEVLHASYDPDVVDTPSGIMVLPPQAVQQVPGSRAAAPPRGGR